MNIKLRSRVLPKLSDFPLRDHDKLRYGDTDRQGHVNNAVFSTFLETGRVGMLESAAAVRMRGPFSFVIARLNLDYREEILWPGRVEIGTGVAQIGNTSITVSQALFQEEKCVATAQSVVVQVHAPSKRTVPLGDELRQYLTELLLPPVVGTYN